MSNADLIAHEALLAKNFTAYTGRPFPKEPMQAEFAILSHDTQDDPVFNYANMKALELFEYSFDEITLLPSRLSAEAAIQEERKVLLNEVKERGYSENYQGVRISKSGKRFLITKALIWNLHDASGTYAGQAAILYDWSFDF